MKTGIKLKALLLGFSICASVGALAGTSALLSNNTQDEISASSVYADEQGSTPEDTETAEVAEISGSAEKYATLQEAINAAKENGTVVLLRNTYANVTIAQEKNITLDLNGCVLNGGTVASTPTITNNGTLTIIDSSKAQTGTIKRDDQTNSTGWHYVIDNQGVMTIKQAIVVNNSGTTDCSSGASLIRNGGNKTESFLTIENGTFTQNNFIVIKNDDYGTLTINGGTFYSANSYAVENWCHATLNGGVLNGSLFVGAYNAEYGMGETVFTGDAVLKGRIRMYTHGNTHVAPQLSVTGGTLNIEALTIDNVAYCDLSISGGTFTGYNPAEKNFLADGYAVQYNEETQAYTVVKGVAQVTSGETTNCYAALQEAINAAQAGDTVTLLNDVDSTAQITIGTNITLDLNGKELCSTYTPQKGQIVISAEVTICDSSQDRTGCIRTNYAGTTGRTVELSGASAKLTLESGTIYGMPANSSNSGSAVYLGANTTFLMKGGKIKLENAKRNSYAVNVFGELSSFVFENGEIIVDGTEAYGVSANMGAITTINGGKITATKAITSTQSETAILGGDIKGTVVLSNKASISGGTFSNYFNPKFLATGYGVISSENGYKIESGYAAQTATDSAFGTAYKTLAEAISGAESGSTVYLLSDVSDFAGVQIGKNLTVNFGKYTVTGKTGVTCFTVTNASVTFKADKEGGVNGGSGGNNKAITAGANAVITIESGNYTVGGDAKEEGNSTVFVTDNGKVIIKGGTFSSEAAYNGKYYVLNLKNNSTGSFEVSGGTFINYNPATGDDNLGGNFVAAGYVSYKSAEDAKTVTYTVGVTVFKSVQATLGSDITMKFTLPSQNYTVSVTLMVNGKEQTITLENPTKEKGKYVYQFTGLTPQMIDREFTITAYDKNGILRDSYTYSVLEYCNDLLAQDSVTSETKQVVAELLNYGAAAQKYVGADSSELQEEIKQSGIALLTDEPQGEVSATGTEQIVAGATVNFSNVNKIVFAITQENYEKLDSYTITINDIAVEKSAWVLSGDYYMWYSDGIKATEFGKSYKLVVTKGSETVQTIEISVNAYCSVVYNMSGVPEALQNLVKATYNYGMAAKSYAESSK